MAKEWNGPLAKQRQVADRDAAMRILYEAGWSDGRITRVLRAGRHLVPRWRKRHGLQRHPTHYLNLIDDRAALLMYDEQASDGEIAKALNVTQSGVSRWRYRNGLEANYENRHLEPRVKRSMVAMLSDGASRKQVIDEHGCGHVTTMSRYRRKIVSPYLRSNGITDGFVRSQVLRDTGIQVRIARAVGTNLPSDIHHDAATSLYVDVLAGRLDHRLIETRASRYRSQAFNLNGHDFGTRSLDDPGDDGLSLLDRLNDPAALEDIWSAAEDAYDDD